MGYRKATAFTLIEMLIVIVIIGILAAALVPRLRDIQERGRDTKRKVDIRQIRNAIAIYYADNSSLPQYKPQTSCGWSQSILAVSSGTCWWQWLTTSTSFYTIMSSVPVDPVNQWYPHAVYGDSNYIYTYLNGTWSIFVTPDRDYLLATQLENTKDPDRCGITPYYYLHTASATWGPWCPPHSGYLDTNRSQRIYAPNY